MNFDELYNPFSCQILNGAIIRNKLYRSFIIVIGIKQ